jgi:recombination protein RecT
MTAMTTTNGRQQLARKGAGRVTLKSYLSSPAVRNKLAEAAGSLMKPDDLIRMALVAASRTPDLGKCSQDSILRSLLDAASLGVQPGGLMGRGYLVPRKNRKNNTVECNFDPGWRGLADIARRSGKVRLIEAHVVYSKDVFTVKRAPLTTVEHVPCEDADPGPVRAAFAVALFSDGAVQIEIVTKRDLDKIRKMGADGGPWASWYDEMARKTAVRRLCKYLPYDPILERAMAVSDAADVGETAIDVADLDDGPGDPKDLEASLLAEQGESKPGVEYDPETGEVVPPAKDDADRGGNPDSY